MDSSLTREQTVRIVTFHTECSRLDASFFSRLQVKRFSPEAFAFCPPEIHSQKHLCPILCIRTAGAGIDCHDGITRIVFAAEEHLCFALLYLMLKSRERLSQLARRGVVLSCKFKEHFNVFESARLLDCGRYYTLQP
jgi:hypothetical protein